MDFPSPIGPFHPLRGFDKLTDLLFKHLDENQTQRTAVFQNLLRNGLPRRDAIRMADLLVGHVQSEYGRQRSPDPTRDYEMRQDEFLRYLKGHGFLQERAY
jgi:hypothetical protein